MASVDDAAAQRDLNATLERFRGDPRLALGLGSEDDAAAARRAFMALCKIYHPAKFARFAPATVRLSNEVFLAIRRAYETTAAALAAPATAAAPPSPAGLSAGRAATGSGVQPPVRQPVPTPASRTSGVMPRLRATPAGGVPVTRLPTAPAAPPSRAPTSTRTATPAGGVPVRSTAPPPTPSGAPATPGRPGAAPPPPVPRDPSAAFEQALELARQQRWAEARAAFAQLAARDPSDARARAYLHCARGWESFAQGKSAEARAEWQRALACDPGNGLARWALDSTGVAR